MSSEEEQTIEESNSDDGKKGKSKVEKVPKPSNEELLGGQISALNRLIKNFSETSVVELGRKIGVDKQAIYLWMRGKSLIPEHKVQLLAEIFGVHPAEIRYDIPAFNSEDLKSVVMLLEIFLKSKNLELDPERKTKAVLYLYNKKQSYRRLLLQSFSEAEFNKSAQEYLEQL